MTPQNRIVRFAEAIVLSGLSRPTIYRKMANGTFPKRFKIGRAAIGWRLSDILAWLANPR